MAYACVRDVDLAEEVVQQAFVVASGKRDHIPVEDGRFEKDRVSAGRFRLRSQAEFIHENTGAGGRFRLTHVPPGTIVLRLNGLPDGFESPKFRPTRSSSGSRWEDTMRACRPTTRRLPR